MNFYYMLSLYFAHIYPVYLHFILWECSLIHDTELQYPFVQNLVGFTTAQLLYPEETWIVGYLSGAPTNFPRGIY